LDDLAPLACERNESAAESAAESTATTAGAESVEAPRRAETKDFLRGPSLDGPRKRKDTARYWVSTSYQSFAKQGPGVVRSLGPWFSLLREGSRRAGDS
jgi:hypothetical protein